MPSESILPDVLIRVDPGALDRGLQRWNQDPSLALDAKTLGNAIEENAQQLHLMSVLGHRSKNCYTEKSRHPAVNGQRCDQAHPSRSA